MRFPRDVQLVYLLPGNQQHFGHHGKAFITVEYYYYYYHIHLTAFF